MDDKVFNLLEKMYSEFTEFKQDMNEFRKDITSKVTKIETTLENDIKPDIKLALQGYHDTNEKLTVIDEKLDALSDKVDHHDIKIQVIEGGKRA